MRKYLLLFALLFGTSVYAQTIDFDGQGTCSAVASQGEAVSWSCTGEVSPPPPPEVQCVDGLDNDGDGLIDINDPGCSSPQDNDESDDNPPPPPPVLAQCEDGVDNDGDSLVDLADPGCSSSSDDDETDVVEPPPPPPPSSFATCWGGMNSRPCGGPKSPSGYPWSCPMGRPDSCSES